MPCFTWLKSLSASHWSHLCDADYVGFTTRHLRQCIQEHTSRYSAIGKHLIIIHGGIDTSSLSSHFSILRNAKLSLTVFCMKCFSLRNLSLHSILKRTPFKLSLLLDCISRVNSIHVTSCFTFIIYSSLFLFSLLDNDFSRNFAF